MKQGETRRTTEPTVKTKEEDGLAVRNLPANVEDAGSIPDQEDPLEKEMVTHSNILAWRIPQTEELCRLQCMEAQKSWTQLSNQTTTNIILASNMFVFFS